MQSTTPLHRQTAFEGLIRPSQEVYSRFKGLVGS